MHNIHSDYCFVDGELVLYKDLHPDLKYPREGRLSYTDLSTLNTCPYKYFNQTRDDVGTQPKDSSVHGVLGHYLVGCFLKHIYYNLDNFEDFKYEAMKFAEDVLTHNKIKDRSKITKTYTYMNFGYVARAYVTRQFNIDKYLDKIAIVLDNLEETYNIVRPGSFKNLYVETGVYTTYKGFTLFGKIDLIVEHNDNTYTLIDHKSSFNTLYFQRYQLPIYSLILGEPIRDLIINDLSSGHGYKYKVTKEELVNESKDFIDRALSLYIEDKPKILVGPHCQGCTVDCIEDQSDDDGYITL